jgi:hypothetical protein
MRKTLFLFMILAGIFNSVQSNGSLPLRGFCISAPRLDELNAFIKFIDEELAPRHVNTLILRVDYISV